MTETNRYTAVCTVVGTDKPGIIAEVTRIFADNDVNIVNISQTILEDLFQMVMLIDTKNSKIGFLELADILDEKGKEIACQIILQEREVFSAMHRI